MGLLERALRENKGKPFSEDTDGEIKKKLLNPT